MTFPWPSCRSSLSQLAEEILDEIEESHIELSGIVRLVDQIAALRPPDK
jgi:hypothetical protein